MMTNVQSKAALICALLCAAAGLGRAEEPPMVISRAERDRVAAMLKERWDVQVVKEEVRPGVREVVGLQISHKDFTDENLAQITKLTWVRSISISTSKIKGPGLAHLRGLERLRVLELDAPSLAGGLQHLKGLQKLERVSIGRMPVTVEDMKFVGQLGNLRNLSLIYNGITDAGLAELKPLTQLEILSMEEKQITDKGLKHLEALNNLEVLNLNQSKVTDAGLPSLAKLPRLRSLGLQGVKGVTDAGIRHFAALKRLDNLYLDGTSLTDKGVRELAATTNLYQLYVPDWISDAAFDEVKKSMREPRNAKRLRFRR